MQSIATPFDTHCYAQSYATRDEWLRARGGEFTVGGSEAADVWNDDGSIEGAYGDPLGLYTRKIRPYELRERDEKEEKFLRRGQLMEPVIVSEYAEEFPDDRVIDFGPTTIMTSKQWPWLTASIDRGVIPSVGDAFVLECKNRFARLMYKWEDDAPLAVKLQCTHYMAVTGAPRAIIAVDFGTGTRFVEVPRDEQMIELHWRACRDFVELHVRGRNPPEATMHEASKEALREYRGKQQGVIKQITDPAVANLLGKLLRAKEQKKRYDSLVEGYGNRVRQLIGEDGGILGMGYSAKMTPVRESHRKASVVKAYRRLDVDRKGK